MIFPRTKQEWFLGIVAFVLTGALWRVFSTTNEGSLDGDSRTQIILVLLYSVVMVLVLRNFRLTVWVLLRSSALPALLVFACLSGLWAETPDLVVRRAISLVGTSMFGVLLAVSLTFAQQLKLLRVVFRLAAVLSLAVLVISPSHGMAADFGSGAARGIFTHKNLFGAAMALGFLVECYLPDENSLARAFKLASLGLYAVLLVLSHSATSVVTVSGTLIILWMFETLHNKYRLPLSALFLFVAGLVVCALVLGIDAGSVTGMVGRSSDLTGRTELWKAVGGMILTHPMLGFGFSGFWGGASSESISVENYIGWSPTYSHNGYLEILLSLGLVGTLLFLMFLRAGVIRALEQAAAKVSKEDQWPLAFFVFFMLHNLAECSIVWQNCLEWSLCVSTVLGTHMQLQAILRDSDDYREASLMPEMDHSMVSRDASEARPIQPTFSD
jgi:exopolysaccharide production protein ExoQ